MKTLAVICVVVGIAVAAPAGESRQAAGCISAFYNVPNVCANNPSGQTFFAHPSDPTKFLQCDIFNRMYIIQCPIGEEFRLSSSGCQPVAQQPVTARPVTATTQPPTTPKPVVVTSAANSNNIPCSPQSVARGQLYFPFAGDKSRFYECDLQGSPIVVNCPSMLVWDQNILSCVYPLNTTGQAKPTPQMTAGQPNNPCTAENVAAGRLFFPHRNQTKYVQCDLMGNAYTNSCPARLVWNAFLETCYSPMLPASTGRK